MGAECLSGNDVYHSIGRTLKEAKEKLTSRIGCTNDYFDDPEYTTITEVKNPVVKEFFHRGFKVCKYKMGQTTVEYTWENPSETVKLMLKIMEEHANVGIDMFETKYTHALFRAFNH